MAALRSCVQTLYFRPTIVGLESKYFCIPVDVIKVVLYCYEILHVSSICMVSDIFFKYSLSASASARPSIFGVSGRITMKFCTGIDHQSLSSNVKKYLHKMNDVIILRPLSVVQNYTTNAINSIINSHIMVNFCKKLAHGKTIPHTK